MTAAKKCNQKPNMLEPEKKVLKAKKVLKNADPWSKWVDRRCCTRIDIVINEINCI